MSEQTSTSKSPSHYVYHIREIKGQKGIWSRVGAAWAQKDGKGFNIQLDSVPLDGRLTLRVPSDIKE